LESGADGYLTQPVDAAVLTATVNALLRLSRAEARAREAARAWEAVFGAISDSVCLINSDGCVQRCNRAMAALVGKPVEEVEGHQYADILIETYPGTAFPPEMTTPVERQAIIEIPIASSERQHWLRLTAEPMIAGLTGDAAADGSSIRILADITDSKEAALRQRSFLRDILASVTEGKLHLCLGAEDLPEPLPQQDKKVQLSQKSLHYLREDVRKIANTLGFPQDRQQDLETAVGEAGMNAVVHAGHGIGHVHANETGTIQVWIEDSGRGIAIERIHRATLERGYTTAGTLGHGFWIILKTCDRVYLLTSEAGTTVVLEQDRVAPSPAWAKPPMI